MHTSIVRGHGSLAQTAICYADKKQKPFEPRFILCCTNSRRVFLKAFEYYMYIVCRIMLYADHKCHATSSTRPPCLKAVCYFGFEMS